MKIYGIAIALAAATLLSGCRRAENPTSSATSATPVPLMVSVGVDRLTSRAGVVTGEAFTNGQKINVILVDETPLSTPTPEYPVMSPYVCSITGVDPDEVTTWNPVAPATPPTVVIHPASVLAHYPEVLPNASKLSADKRTLEIDIPAEIPYGKMGEWNFNAVAVDIAGISTEVWFAKGDEDYMSGYGGTVSAVPSVLDPSTAQNKTNIVMKHSLAMVVVQLVMDPTNPDNGKTIDGLWVNNIDPLTGPLQKGSVNLADNAFTPNAQRTAYSRPMAGFYIAGRPYFGMLVYPAAIGTVAPDVEIVSAVSAARYTYKVPAVAWEAGKVYLYTLRLTPASGVLSDGVRVVDWPETIEVQVEVE